MNYVHVFLAVAILILEVSKCYYRLWQNGVKFHMCPVFFSPSFIDVRGESTCFWFDGQKGDLAHHSVHTVSEKNIRIPSIPLMIYFDKLVASFWNSTIANLFPKEIRNAFDGGFCGCWIFIWWNITVERVALQILGSQRSMNDLSKAT